MGKYNSAIVIILVYGNYIGIGIGKYKMELMYSSIWPTFNSLKSEFLVDVASANRGRKSSQHDTFKAVIQTFKLVMHSDTFT